MKRLATRFAVLCLLCLTACGKEASASEADDQPTAAVDWRTNGFTVSGDMEEEQQLWVDHYEKWEHEIPLGEKEEVFHTHEMGTLNGKIYRLLSIIEPPIGVARRMYLEIYDPFTRDLQTKEFQPLGLIDNLIDVDADLISETEFAYQMQTFETGGEEEFPLIWDGMIYTTMEGEQSEADMLHAFMENEVVQPSYPGIILMPNCTMDGAGNNYVRKQSDGRDYPSVVVFARDGSVIMEYVVPNYANILEPFKLEGEIVFPVQNMDKSMDYLWFDVSKQEVKSLAHLEESELIRRIYGYHKNCLYFETLDGIVKWNADNGQRKLIFDFEENGVSIQYEKMLVFPEDGAPILRMYGYVNEEYRDLIAVLSPEEVETEDAIRIVNLVGTDKRLATAVGVANRDNLNHRYQLEVADKDTYEARRTKLLADLTAGNGPDMMYLSCEDFELLRDKGLFADLESLISEEDKKRILPGVLELGRADGILQGFPLKISTETILISESVGAGDSWTLDEMISLMDQGKLSGRMTYAGKMTGPAFSLGRMLQYCLADSFLIDWEKRESHFDDDRFVRWLDYSVTPVDMDQDYTEMPLGEHGELLHCITNDSFMGIGYMEGSYFAKDGYYIGYPAKEHSGTYLMTLGVLVVNRASTNLEAIEAFFHCCLSNEVQFTEDDMNVLAIDYDDYFYDEEIDSLFWVVGRKAYGLNVFPDGTTSIDQAKRMYEHCSKAPRMYQSIMNIFDEEIWAFIDGDKSAKEVAETIDKRVQVYLDEENETHVVNP